MTYEKTAYEENGSRIEIAILIRCILERWKILIASGLICALMGVIVATVTYVPQYTSTIKYVINTEQATNSGLKTETFLVAEYLANTYSHVIKGRDFIDRIKAETGIEEDISRYVSSQLLEGSNVMKVVIRTTDSEKTYRIAEAISLYLPEKAKETVHNGSLDSFEQPRRAIMPDTNGKPFKMAVIGGFLGVILAAAVIVFLQMVRNTVMTPNALTDRVDVKHIGSVPHVDVNKKKNKTANHEPMLVTNKKTGFVFNETYKSMRTKIERFSKKNNCKAILVTSALENEGKTTVAVNIALALAQNGNKVVMLDCDLRKPAVATVLDAKDKINIQAIDVIRGQASVDKAIVRLEKFNLDIIGGLKAVNNSSEVLSTKGLKSTIDTLKQNYDYIIVDTPPSQLFTDAAIISEYTDAGIMVVRQNSANVDDVISVISDISQSDVEIIGFVFNNVIDASILPGGYSKKYNYSYYGYGSRD